MSLPIMVLLTILWSFDTVSSSCSLAETIIPNPSDPIAGTPIQVRTSGQYTNESREFRIQSAEQLFYEQNDTVKINVCMIADGAECFPMYFNHDDFTSEYLQLQSYFRRTLENTNFTTRLPKLSKAPLRDRTTGALQDTDFNREFAVRYEELELEFKSFFCQSGKCVLERRNGMPFPRRDESFKCAPGTPNASAIIPYLEFQRKLLQLNKDISSDVCKETVNRVRVTFNSGRYTPSRRAIHFEPGSSGYVVRVCLVEEGMRCYPDNYTEAKIYDEFLAKYGKPLLEDLRRHGDGRRDGHALTIYNLFRPPPHPKNDTKDFFYDDHFKDFFCASGSCNRSNTLCDAGPLIPKTLKLYLTSLGKGEPYQNPNPSWGWSHSAPKNPGSISTILTLSVFGLIPSNPRTKASLLPLMLLTMVSSIWAVCDGLGRTNTEFEEVPDIYIITRAKKDDESQSFDQRSEKVLICLVKDNKVCNDIRHLNLNQYDPGGSGDYFVYFERLLPDSYLALTLLSRLPTSDDSDGFNKQFRGAVQQEEVKLKSFFCKSGKCDTATNICNPGETQETRNYSGLQTSLRNLQAEMVSYPLLTTVCELTVGKFRSRKMVVSRGLIQHKPEDPILEVAVCLLTTGAECFPFNETESSSYYRDYYDKDIGVLPPETESPPKIPEISTEKNGGKIKFDLFTLKGTKRLFLKQEIVDWFCFTGECDDGKCRHGTKRVSKVLKLYRPSSGASFIASAFNKCVLVMAFKAWI